MSDLPKGINWPEPASDYQMTCYCRCGAVYRSSAKSVKVDIWRGVTQKPCPGCGSHINCNRLSSDPETMSL